MISANSLGLDLLRADHISSRELRVNMTRYLHKDTLTVVTMFGKRKSVLVPWKLMVEIFDQLEAPK